MSKEIVITKKHEAKIPEYVERFRKIGLDTTPCDRPLAEKSVVELFAEINRQKGYENTLPKPTRFMWFDNPFDASYFAAKLALPQNFDFGRTGVLAQGEPTREQVKDTASKASYGSFEAYWVAFYSFCKNELPVEQNPLVDRSEDVVKNCGIYWGLKSPCGEYCVIIMCDKPSKILIKDDKLHSDNEMAMQFRDGTGFYAINGTPYKTIVERDMERAYKK